MKQSKTIGSVLLSILTIFLCFLFLLPVIWAFAVSFQSEGTQISTAFDWFTPPYTFENYPRILFDTSVPTWTWNSLLVTTISLVLQLAITSLAAYAIAKIDFKGRGAFLIYGLLGIMVPGEATIVPLFITANTLNLINTYAGLILPSITSSANLFIMIAFFRSIPREMTEAADIDGASHFQIYLKLILPLSKAIMMTVGIFAFIGSWNNYLWPLLSVMSEDMYTLPIGLPSFVGTYTIDYVAPLTAAMVASIPALIIFLLFERQIVQGITLTGLKG